MGTAPLSVHGFVSVKGRGYRPEQVDLRVSVLCRQRDELWERAARLTVLARDMEGEAEVLRARVAALVPQTYESLGPGAQRVLAAAVEEEAALRARTREECRALLAAGEAAGRRVTEAAGEQAEAVRAEAEACAGRVLAAARESAEAERAEAVRGIEEQRGEVLASVEEVRLRTQAVIDELERDRAERLAAQDREFADRKQGVQAANAERETYAESALVDAQRLFSEAREQARRVQEESQERAAELLAQARARAEGIARETERLLAEHVRTRDEVRAHMARVQQSLSALTGGRAPAEN
ncbi:cellulose-binding protein [Streptomyces sp. NPDC001780]